MTWPPQSPELNPIEIVCDEFDLRVKEKQPTSAQHMWELLQDFWKSIPGDQIMKLVERMPRVCKAVIEAKGGYFEESKYKIYFDLFNTVFGYYMIPCVLFHSFDVFTIILQCRKQ